MTLCGGARAAVTRLPVARRTDLTREELSHVYLGPAGLRDLHRLLKNTSCEFLDFRGREEDLMAHVAGRFPRGEGGAGPRPRVEFGPRSLGARSILADPRRPEMRDKINAQIKLRESFRPFAPARAGET